MIKPAIMHCEPVLTRFAALNKNQRLAHAYLFVGPAAVGKSETALAIAKLVNCVAPVDGLFCDGCESCIKINSGQHPDVSVIDAQESDSIKIVAIRDLIRRAELKPFQAEKKVFIIKNAEDLTIEAANALLKTLEEPAKNSLLVLTTNSLEKNLDTIKSRCHLVHFYPVANDVLAERLRSECKVDKAAAHFLAHYAQGCFGKAQRFRQQKLFDKKNAVIDNFVSAAGNDAYFKKLAADKEQLKNALELLLSWFRDILLVKSGVAQASLIHADRVRELEAYAKQYSFEELKVIIDGVIDTTRQVNDNFNVKIALALLKEQIWRR